MKAKWIWLAGLWLFFSPAFQLRSQGYIVPNGVVTNLFPGEIDVWNPGSQITGFTLTPSGESEPTGFPNIFVFDEPVTIGVRVFLVSLNDPVSLQAIQSQSYPEPSFGSSLVFDVGNPFYVGLYTGFNFAPPYPPYPPFTYLDPVFGWAELVNNNGVIEVLDSAVEYKGDGIYAGTQNIIQPSPEPGFFGLFVLGGLFFALRRRQNYSVITFAERFFSCVRSAFS